MAGSCDAAEGLAHNAAVAAYEFEYSLSAGRSTRLATTKRRYRADLMKAGPHPIAAYQRQKKSIKPLQVRGHSKVRTAIYYFPAVQRFCIYSLGSAMHFCYRACTIDATPQFSVGRYFARARIEPSQDLSEPDGDATYESADLGDFSTEADAVGYAYEWAIRWVDENLNPVVCRIYRG